MVYLETNRLDLNSVNEQDRSFMRSMENDIEVMRYIGGDVYSESESEAGLGGGRSELSMWPGDASADSSHVADERVSMSQP